MIWNNAQKLRYRGEKTNKIFIKNIIIVVSLKVDNSMYVQKYECSFRASNYKSVIKSLTYKSEEEVKKLKFWIEK